MKKPIVDHFWSKIVESDSRGIAAAEQKLQEVVELGRRISQTEGKDVANNVMSSGLIETALLRCKEFHEGRKGLAIDDLYINYRYATQAMLEAERVIDAELGHLDL